MTAPPYYIVSCKVMCKAINGRDIPWSEELMGALEDNHTLIDAGWRRNGNDEMEAHISVLDDHPFSSTQLESLMMTAVSQLVRSGETYGVGEIRLKFDNSQVVMMTAKSFMRMNDRRVAVLF